MAAPKGKRSSRSSRSGRAGRSQAKLTWSQQAALAVLMDGQWHEQMIVQQQAPMGDSVFRRMAKAGLIDRDIARGAMYGITHQTRVRITDAGRRAYDQARAGAVETYVGLPHHHGDVGSRRGNVARGDVVARVGGKDVRVGELWRIAYNAQEARFRGKPTVIIGEARHLPGDIQRVKVSLDGGPGEPPIVFWDVDPGALIPYERTRRRSY